MMPNEGEGKTHIFVDSRHSVPLFKVGCEQSGLQVVLKRILQKAGAL